MLRRFCKQLSWLLLLSAACSLLTAEAQTPVATSKTGKESLKLKPLEWFPQAIDIGPGQRKEKGAKWEVQISTVQLTSSKEASEIAKFATKVKQEAKNPDSTSAKSTPGSEALRLWQNIAKKLGSPTRKEIRPKIEEYRTSLTQDITDVTGPQEHERSLQANVAAQESIMRVVEEKVENGVVHAKEFQALAKVHEALRGEEKQIRDARASTPEDSRLTSAYVSSGIGASNADEKVIADFGAGKVVASNNSPPEVAAAFLAPPASTALATVTLTPQYGPEMHANDADADMDLIKSADACVAIRTTEHKLVGSGILIGHNLVLTCGHVLGGEGIPVDIQKYEVLSEQRNNLGGLDPHVYPLGERVAYGKIWSLTGNDLDYALFEVGPGRGDNVLISDRIKENREIGLTNLNREQAIYLYGYPEHEQKRIRPEGKVIYSYHDVLDGATLMYFFAAAMPEGHTDASINRLFDEFKGAYKKTGNFYCLVRKVGLRGLQPVYGVECNSYPGHSGSPVFSWQRRQLIGMFIGGKGNGPNRKHATWTDMEFVLPLAPILEQLDQDPKLHGWQQRYGVRIARDNFSSASQSIPSSPSLVNRSK